MKTLFCTGCKRPIKVSEKAVKVKCVVCIYGLKKKEKVSPENVA